MFFIFSCTEDKNVELDQNLYSKIVHVSDNDNNVVEVKLSSVTEEIVENFDVSSLKLRTTKETDLMDRQNSVVENDLDLQADNEENLDYYDKTLFIDAISRNLKEDVTGFFVSVENDNSEIDVRTSTYYAYGSWGVRGAAVQYTWEKRSSCYLDIDLDKRTTSSSNWWTEMSDGTLPNVPGFWADVQSTEYYRYRLKVNSQGWRCWSDSNVSWNAWWLY